MSAGEGPAALDRGIAAARNGDFEQAESLFCESRRLAEEAGDQALWDRAYCNSCGVRIEKGLPSQELNELRRIMLRTSCGESAFLAAYNISRAYELKGDLQRALFYAGVAKDRSRPLDSEHWLGWSHNQVGNLLLAKGDFESAATEYEQALSRSVEPGSFERAMIYDNLGYCHIVRGNITAGYTLLYAALRTLRKLRSPRFEAPVRLSLCYAHLEQGKLRAAQRQGQRALDLATEFSDQNSIKYGHFLLGEVYNQLGCADVAYDHFSRLQQRFYPEIPNIPDLLVAIDVSAMINLKA